MGLRRIGILSIGEMGYHWARLLTSHGVEVLTYSNLTRVFETDVYVDTNALTGKLLIVPLPGNVRRGPRTE